MAKKKIVKKSKEEREADDRMLMEQYRAATSEMKEIGLTKEQIESQIRKKGKFTKEELERVEELKKIEEEKFDIKNFFENPDKLQGFIPNRLGNVIKSMFYFKTPRDTQEIYFYNDGGYLPQGDTKIRETIRKILGDKTKDFCVKETISSIRETTYIDRKEINKHKNYLCLKNGLFNTDIMKLEQHNPDIITTVKLPITYDPKANCPKWKEFISDVAYPEDQPVLQEFFGYCLYLDYFIRSIFVLVGDGGNGKTVFMKVLESFLGVENISGVSMQDFSKDRFAKARLFGRLANICDDLPAKTIYDTGVIKQLTGGSLIEAQHKFKARFNFTNFAKVIFATNKLPEIKDRSRAIWDRIKTITFPYEFVDNPTESYQKKKIPRDKFLKQLTSPQELSGMFNWAVDGLKRLLKQGDFSYSKSHEETREEYERKANVVKAFHDDKILYVSDNMENKRDGFAEFVTYCKERGLPIVSYDVFCKRILELCGVRITESRPLIGDKRSRVWVGIKIIRGGESQKDGESQTTLTT